MDGGGSGMGQGTSTNYWTPGYDGVRITVVDASSGSAVSSPVDFSNKTFNKPLVHFAKKNKFQYLAGAALEPAGGSYVYQIPAVAMPYIMTSNPSLPISKIPENIFVPNMQRRWLPMPPVYPTTV